MDKTHNTPETNIEQISEMPGPRQKQSGRINDLLRYWYCCSDKQMGDKSATNLTTDHITGWHGPSSKTLRDLLQKVSKLDMKYYKTMDDLYTYIYYLYSFKDEQQDFKHTIEDKDYQKNLDGINCPKSVSKQIQESKEGKWGAYIHFINTNNTAKCEERISLNVQLDHIPTVTKYLVKKFAKSDYIFSIKVAYTVDTAIHSLDNIILYLQDLDKKKNRENLQHIITECARYTQTGNPAIMETIVSGIAIADNKKGKGFGQTRVEPIIEAIEGLLKEGKEINDLDTLLERVRERFEYHNIDIEKPHRNSKGKSKKE